MSRERRIGKIGAKRHDDDRGHSELPTRPRLNERNEIGANDVDDERLGHERFDKPASVKQRGRVGLFRAGAICEARGEFCRWHEVEMVAFENEPHHGVGRVVENRTDRADADDEFCDLADVPRPRLGDLLRADVVGRNRHLREVVEQIVREHLNGRHRHEGKPGAGADHAEHVSEIGAGAHANVFEDVHEDLAAFEHALLQNHQTLLQQNHVRRFLGDIDGVIHRNAHIGGAQARARR